MLVLQIALGVVLGGILLANLGRVIAWVGAGIAILFYLGLAVFFIGGLGWLSMERPHSIIAMASIFGFLAMLWAAGSLVANKTRLTSEEAFGSILVSVFAAFALYSMTEKYLKYGDISQEAMMISPFLVIVAVLARVLVKRVSDRNGS